MISTLKRVGSVLLIVSALAAATAGGFAAWYARQSLHIQQSATATSTVVFTGPTTLGSAKTECATTVAESGLQVSGIARTVRDEDIWLLIQAPGAGRFYLTAQKPLGLDRQGNWSQSVSTIGSSADRGSRFTLVAVAANLDAESVLERAATKPPAGDSPYVEALPVGAYAVAQGCMVRG
jgi:hypothetical protein